MKLGILPVSLVSNAHLRPQGVFPHTILSQFFCFYIYHYVNFRKFAIEKSCRLVLTLPVGFLN